MSWKAELNDSVETILRKHYEVTPKNIFDQIRLHLEELIDECTETSPMHVAYNYDYGGFEFTEAFVKWHKSNYGKGPSRRCYDSMVQFGRSFLNEMTHEEIYAAFKSVCDDDGLLVEFDRIDLNSSPPVCYNQQTGCTTQMPDSKLHKLCKRIGLIKAAKRCKLAFDKIRKNQDYQIDDYDGQETVIARSCIDTPRTILKFMQNSHLKQPKQPAA